MDLLAHPRSPRFSLQKERHFFSQQLGRTNNVLMDTRAVMIQHHGQENSGVHSPYSYLRLVLVWPSLDKQLSTQGCDPFGAAF